MSTAYIITISSEKGGVGKTTLATNLAIYLKALHEDLPVTLLSFDNHFSGDRMRPSPGIAAIPPHRVQIRIKAATHFGDLAVGESGRASRPCGIFPLRLGRQGIIPAVLF